MYNIWMILIMTPRCEGKTWNDGWLGQRSKSSPQECYDQLMCSDYCCVGAGWTKKPEPQTRREPRAGWGAGSWDLGFTRGCLRYW